MDMSSVPPISGPAALSNHQILLQRVRLVADDFGLVDCVAEEPTMVTFVSGPAPPHIPPAHRTSQDTASLQSGSSISVYEEIVPNNENTMEPTMVASVSGLAPPHIPTSQVSASLQSGSPISISEDMVPNNENIKETTPIFCVMTQSLGPFGDAAANVGILNGVAFAISATPAVLSSGKLGSTSMTGVASFARTDQISQIFGPASSTVMAPSMFGNPNPCMSQSLSNIQGGIGASSQIASVMSRGNLLGSQIIQSGIVIHQNVLSEIGTGMSSGQLLSNIQGGIGAGNLTAPGMSQGNLPGSQMMQSGIDMHQNVPSGMGTSMPSGQLLSNIQGRIGAGTLTAPVMSRGNLPRSQMMPSGIGMHQNVPSGMGSGMPSEIGTMMPTPVMTQQGQLEILPLGRNNSADANMSLAQQQTLATSSSAQSGFIQIWEGNLSLVRWGEPEHISRLQGWYKRSSASESLAANFPQTLQILCLIPKALMMKLVEQRTGKADVLAFWAIDRHAILNYLQEMNVGGLISLASKTLFVYVSDKTYRLMGYILPYKYVAVMLTTPNQQLQARPPHQLQQLLGQPLYQGQQLQEQQSSQVQHLQEQSLSQAQQLQEQPLSQGQQLQEQQFPQAQQLHEQPLSQVQQLQGQPFSQVQQLQQQLPQVQQLQEQPLSQVQQLQEQPLSQVRQPQEQPLSQVQQLQEQPLSQAQKLQAQLIPDANWDDDDFQALCSFLDD